VTLQRTLRDNIGGHRDPKCYWNSVPYGQLSRRTESWQREKIISIRCTMVWYSECNQWYGDLAFDSSSISNKRDQYDFNVSPQSLKKTEHRSSKSPNGCIHVKVDRFWCSLSRLGVAKNKKSSNSAASEYSRLNSIKLGRKKKWFNFSKNQLSLRRGNFWAGKRILVAGFLNSAWAYETSRGQNWK